MKLVIQRVSRAQVSVSGQTVGEIGAGALILAGVARGDTPQDVVYLARKVSQLRMFDDAEGKMNLSSQAMGGAFLVVSQFTLYADSDKGNRPGFAQAAPPLEGRRMFDEFVNQLRLCGHPVQTGSFGEHMNVELVNDGPVTLILESRGRLA